MKKFITNKRGMTLVSMIFYITAFLVMIMISSMIVLDVGTASNINKMKHIFNKDKDELFRMIEIDSNRIDSTSIKIEPAVTGVGNKLVYIIKDDINTSQDDSVRVELIQSNKGLAMKRTTPSTSEESKDSSFIVFKSITDVEFHKIDKICTDETLTTGCISVSNLYDIVVYGEEKVNKRNTMNRAKRSFYFHD